MLHLDLFSGIGGFAYAVDQVWDNVDHIFCDNDKFCREVLKKHWPESEIYDDIRDITNTNFLRSYRKEVHTTKRKQQAQYESVRRNKKAVYILTGGFPCQPFSAAGKRRGTKDDRYLWPEMFRVIQLTKPTWVIAENVRGLLTLQQGVVFEQVCTDLEGEGYEVQPLVIPAVAVNAPHRRDRVWFIAHSVNGRPREAKRQGNATQDRLSQEYRSQDSTAREFKRTASNGQTKRHVADSNDKRGRTSKYEDNKGRQESTSKRQDKLQNRASRHSKGWEQDWLEVATRVCRVDDGLPNRVDRIKSLGNAIVPQVAIEIMRGISASS